MLQVFGHHQNAFAWKEHEMFADDLLRPKRLWTRSFGPSIPGTKRAWHLRLVLSGTRCCSLIIVHKLRRATIALHWYLAIGPTDQRKGSKHSITASPDSLSLHRKRRGLHARLSLGCLLAEKLDIELRRVGSGKRLTFSSGETRLSEWMEENARVAWQICKEPWELEEQLIHSLGLPTKLGYV